MCTCKLLKMCRMTIGLWKALICGLLVASWEASPASALSWRLFAGREECISEYIPDAQWDALQEKSTTPHDAVAVVNIGLLVTYANGAEANEGGVDWVLYGPHGQELYRKADTADDDASVEGTGGPGPWRACFTTSHRHVLRPSVMLEITHFSVNLKELTGGEVEWHHNSWHLDPTKAPLPSELGTVDQISELMRNLHHLDYYIHNVTHEQRYLSRRTDRHLVTVRSTHTRTLWYHVGLYSVIIAASFAQVVGVRMMFTNRRRQGLII